MLPPGPLLFRFLFNDFGLRRRYKHGDVMGKRELKGGGRSHRSFPNGRRNPFWCASCGILATMQLAEVALSRNQLRSLLMLMVGTMHLSRAGSLEKSVPFPVVVDGGPFILRQLTLHLQPSLEVQVGVPSSSETVFLNEPDLGWISCFTRCRR